MKFFIVVYHSGIAAWQTTPKLSGLKQQIFIISHVSVCRLMLLMIWAVFVRILRQPCFHGPWFTLLPAAQNSSMGSRLWVLSFFLLPHLLLLSLLVLGAVLHWTFFRFLNFPSSSGHRAFTYILPTARGLSLRPAASSGNTLLIALELHQLWSPPTSDFGRFLCPQLLWTGGFCFPSLHSLKSDG